MKTLFELWAASFYDRTTWPSDWNAEWGPPVELWQLEQNGTVRLYLTKTHIVGRVNENPQGPGPIYHVWDTGDDRWLYCGPNMNDAYNIYYASI